MATRGEKLNNMLAVAAEPGRLNFPTEGMARRAVSLVDALLPGYVATANRLRRTLQSSHVEPERRGNIEVYLGDLEVKAHEARGLRAVARANLAGIRIPDQSVAPLEDTPLPRARTLLPVTPLSRTNA